MEVADEPNAASTMVLKAKDIAVERCAKNCWMVYLDQSIYEPTQFTIIYTTPFSGAEVLPRVKHYLIDIYYKHKKVFSESSPNFGDIRGSKMNKDWMEELMQL